jgi:hypothetical protein
MPVQVSWDDDAQTIIRWDYAGKWAWTEVSSAFEQVNQMMRSVQHPVSIIHDLTQSAGLPGGALANAHRFTAALPENWDISIVVGSGDFTEAMLNIFRKIYAKLGERYKTAATVDEARAIIARHKVK